MAGTTSTRPHARLPLACPAITRPTTSPIHFPIHSPVRDRTDSRQGRTVGPPELPSGLDWGNPPVSQTSASIGRYSRSPLLPYPRLAASSAHATRQSGSRADSRGAGGEDFKKIFVSGRLRGYVRVDTLRDCHVCFAALRFRPHADRADRSTHAARPARRARRGPPPRARARLLEDGIDALVAQRYRRQDLRNHKY